MKRILFIAFLLSGSTLLMAQTFIPKAGVSLAKVSISDDIKNEFYSDPSISYKTGFIVGLAVQFPISDMISIQPELLYHQKGYKLSDEFDGLNYNETVTLNYLELPIMVNFAFGNFYANAGPFLAYGLGGKYNWNIPPREILKHMKGMSNLVTNPMTLVMTGMLMCPWSMV